MYGRQTPNEGASYEYIKSYVEQHQKCLSKVLVGILSDTEQIIKAIIEAAESHTEKEEEK